MDEDDSNSRLVVNEDDSNSRLIVDEHDSGKFRIVWFKLRKNGLKNSLIKHKHYNYYIYTGRLQILQEGLQINTWPDKNTRYYYYIYAGGLQIIQEGHQINT